MAKRLLSQLIGLAAGAALVIGVIAVTGADFGVLRAQDAPAAPMAVSQVLQYQGRLLDPDTGDPKEDAGYPMTFNIYNAVSGGTALWTESKTVAVSNGLFSTLLGDTTALNLGDFNGQELYLGVSVDGDPEAAPRQRLTHVAYAMFAQAVASHTHSGADLQNSTVSASKLAPGVVPKFLSLDPFAARLNGGSFSGGFGPFSGIHFPDGAVGSFDLGFTIPPNYSAGTTLVVRMVWHTSAVNCSISFLGNSISVARVGRTHIVGPTTDTGITVVGGTSLAAPSTANQSNETLINIDAPVSGEKLLPGDSVNFSLFRSGGAAADTCTGDMVIQSFSVTYQ